MLPGVYITVLALKIAFGKDMKKTFVELLENETVFLLSFIFDC